MHLEAPSVERRQRGGRRVAVVVALADADEGDPTRDVVEQAVVAVARAVVRDLEHIDGAPPVGVAPQLAQHGRSSLALDVAGEQEAHPTDVQGEHDRAVVGHRTGVDLAGRPPHVGGHTADLEVLPRPQLADSGVSSLLEPAHLRGLTGWVPDG